MRLPADQVHHEVGRRSTRCTVSAGPTARRRSPPPVAGSRPGRWRGRSRPPWRLLLLPGTASRSGHLVPGQFIASRRPRGTRRATGRSAPRAGAGRGWDAGRRRRGGRGSRPRPCRASVLSMRTHRLDRGRVEVVGGLVEHEEVGAARRQHGQAELGPLAARQRRRATARRSRR